MQIWTEDSGSGFSFWTHINKIIFNSRFKVVRGHGNRTVRDRIEKDNSSELIIAIVDKMIDNNYTEETYKSIIKEARKHSNIFVPMYGSTERAFLTYQHLYMFINNVNKRQEHLKTVVLRNSNFCGAIDINHITDTLFWEFYNNNVKADKTGNKFSESIYSALLASYTNNTYAKITKEKPGPCWLFDCCTLDRRTCKMEDDKNEIEKLKNVMMLSEFGHTVSEIYEAIEIFLNKTYHFTIYDEKWKSKLLNNNISKIDIAYYADRYMKISGTARWNYEKIYRGYKK